MLLVRKFHIIVLLPFWLAACGLKAPLYLPQDAPAPVSQPSQDEQ